MAYIPSRGQQALRRGRWSAAGAEYFITICTRDRQPGLTAPDLLEEVLRQLRAMELAATWHVASAVVMPDHIHLLVEIGEVIKLSGVVRLFKGRLTPALRVHGLAWQQAYFDHRMRSEENRLPVFLYIFLNPYRANLCQNSARWPGYYCADEDWKWFGAMTAESLPVPQWLA